MKMAACPRQGPTSDQTLPCSSGTSQSANPSLDEFGSVPSASTPHGSRAWFHAPSAQSSFSSSLTCTVTSVQYQQKVGFVRSSLLNSNTFFDKTAAHIPSINLATT